MPSWWIHHMNTQWIVLKVFQKGNEKFGPERRPRHEAGDTGDAQAPLRSGKAGIGIFLISHDLHDVFDLADRLVVMKNGKVVGTAYTKDVTHDEVLGMIIAGKCPIGAIPGPGAMRDAA